MRKYAEIIRFEEVRGIYSGFLRGTQKGGMSVGGNRSKRFRNWILMASFVEDITRNRAILCVRFIIEYMLVMFGRKSVC